MRSPQSESPLRMKAVSLCFLCKSFASCALDLGVWGEALEGARSSRQQQLVYGALAVQVLCTHPLL